MRSTWFTRVLRAGIALAALAVMGTQASADVARDAKRRGFNLRAGPFAVMEVNRVLCGLDTQGNVCTAPAGSPILGGGVWPRGTPDQYIFNSGLQIAGVIPTNAGFEWAGDTTGVFFMDPRGDQGAGAAIQQLFSSLDPADNASWPDAGIVRDTSLYNEVLLGRNAVSQQDTWTRYWDGDPGFFGTGRAHPMGILVEQRGMAWNFPVGNEDIIYFVYTFWNITASDPAAYANLDPAIQGAIAALGAEYQQNVQSRLGVNIPDGGYAFENLFAAFFMDPDVGDATNNYSTGILPFQLGLAYVSNFDQESFAFPADVFGPPFAPAPGFVGVKYLRSPIDPATNQEVGLTLFSNTLNQATGFPDPVGVTQMWRYLSGNVNTAAGDNPCTFPNPRQRQLCFLFQDPTDTRFYQSSGPFVLEPGQSATIVVAYVHAAPVAAPLIAAGGPGTDIQPEIAFSGDSIAADPSKVRLIEEIAGWVSAADTNMSGAIEQFEVTSVPRSLLDKSLVAQAVFDNKFLLPFAPEAPQFFLVPGDNQVTVVWEPSPSEAIGDPFFVVASDPGSPLFDANFRQFDVEGYRIYRGRTPGQLELVAQFDYAGTTFVDFSGAFDYGNACAPELGIQDNCPVDFIGGQSNAIGVRDTLIQVPAGGRVELADGSVLIIAADSAVVGSGFPRPADTGVPFGFIDVGVRNSFTYHYAVTAFDVNSLQSGPSSIESARITKSVTPRAPAPNEQVASLSFGLFGDDDVELDPSADFTIDANTGRFSGTPPPTDALSASFIPVIAQLLPGLTLTATIDSLVPRAAVDAGACPPGNGASGTGNFLDACYAIYVTFDDGARQEEFTIIENWGVWSAFGDAGTISTSLGAFAVNADPASEARHGIPEGFSTISASMSGVLREYIRFSDFEGQAARRDLFGDGAGVSPGGSRWFEGDNETVDHPTYGIRVGSGLAGVDTVWAPIHHTDVDPNTAGVQQYAESGAMQCFGYALAGLGRQADVRFTWGAGGSVAEVRDLTHQVPVQFNANPQATYGFVDDNNGNGVIDWTDFNYLETASQAAEFFGFCGHTDPGPGARSSLEADPIIMPTSTSSTGAGATGTGFGLYVNGERFIFELTGGTPPADGTEWTLRTYIGLLDAGADQATTAPSGYRFRPDLRSPAIPGMRVVFTVEAPTQLAAFTEDQLELIHTVPDPYYVTNALEQTANTKILRFVNLPQRAIIRIYSLSGVLVNVLEHNDAGLGSEITWNLRNRNNQFVASGVYFYHVETPEGFEKVGRFTVVNFAQ